MNILTNNENSTHKCLQFRYVSARNMGLIFIFVLLLYMIISHHVRVCDDNDNKIEQNITLY